MKPELKILATLVALLGLLELSFRATETRLSKDIQHLRQLPAQAAAIREASSNTLRLLVVGNSLARCGIDWSLLKTELEQKLERPVVVARMHPDGSRIEEWAYGYWRYFRDVESQPDAILLVTGRQHLVDGLKSVEDLGAFYVGSSEMASFLSDYVHTMDDGVAFFGARYSALLAHRKRVEPRAFYELIPHYEATAQQINRIASQSSRGVESPAATATEALHDDASSTQMPVTNDQQSCRLFAQWLNALNREHVHLILATAPMPKPYSLPESVIQEIQQHQLSIHDAGQSLTLSADRFPDDYHLDPRGASEFTQDLLPTLVDALKLPQTRVSDTN